MKKHGRDTAQAADQTADQAAASPRHKKARLADDIQTAANADNNSAPAAAAAGDLIPVMCGDARGQYSSSKGQVLVESAQDKGSWVSRADFVNRLGGRGSHDYFKAIKVVAPDGSSSGQLGKYLKQHPQGKKQQPKKKPAAAAAAQEEAEAEEQEGSDAAAAAPAEAEAPKSAKRGSAKSGAGASGGSRGNRKSTAAAAADIAAAPPSAAKSAGKARGGRKSAAAAAADTDAAGDGDHDATDAAAAAGSGGNTSPKRTQRSVATKTHQTGKPAAANGRRSKGQSAAAAAAEHEEVAGTTDDVIITDADDGTKAAADDAAAAAVAAADVEEGKNASQQQEQKPKLRKQKKGPAAGKLQGKQPVAAAAAAAAAAAEAEPESAAAEAEPESAAAEAEPESAAAGAADAAATQKEANVIVPAGATSPQLGGEGGGEGAAAPPLNPPLDSLTVDEVFTAAAAAHADTEDQDLGPLINGPDMGQAVGQVRAAGQGGPGADRDEVANEDQWVAGMQYEWQLGAASAAAEPVNDAVPAAAVTQVVPGTPTTEHPAQEHDAAAELAAAAAAVVGDALQQRGPAGAAADTEGKQQQEEAGQMDSDGRNETDTAAAAAAAAPTAKAAAAAAAAAAETEVKAETVPQQQQEEEVAQAGSNRKPAAMEGVEGLGEAGDAAAVAVPAGHPVAVSAAARAAAAAPAVAVPPVALGDAGPSFAQLRAVLPHSEGLDCCWAIAKQVHGTAVNPAGIQVAPILRTYADVATLDDCRQSFRSAAPAQRQQTLERLAALLQLLGEPVVGRNGALRIVGAEEMYDGIQSALADCQKIWESDSSE